MTNKFETWQDKVEYSTKKLKTEELIKTMMSCINTFLQMHFHKLLDKISDTKKESQLSCFSEYLNQMNSSTSFSTLIMKIIFSQNPSLKIMSSSSNMTQYQAVVSFFASNILRNHIIKAKNLKYFIELSICNQEIFVDVFKNLRKLMMTLCETKTSLDVQNFCKF